MTIQTTDGRSVTDTVYVPKGSGCLGIDWADIDAKYRTLVPRAPLSDLQVEKSLATIHEFREVSEASVLLGLLN